MGKKPEKKGMLSRKDFKDLSDFDYTIKTGECIGRNIAIDEYDKFLPDEEEIFNLCLPECKKLIETLKVMSDDAMKQALVEKFNRSLAKAIYERIGK